MRLPGRWDCHGLPVEYEIEQALGVRGRADVEAMGIPAFNAECRAVSPPGGCGARPPLGFEV
jgi:isoleucyl-tRNA synthetase